MRGWWSSKAAGRLRRRMTEAADRVLTFYLLESEDASVTSDTPRFEAEVLRGFHADFWADFAPYLTVLRVRDFLDEARRVERELTPEGRVELDRIRRWVRASGLPVVGYRLEPHGPSEAP